MLLLDVYIHLRERNLNSLALKALVNRFQNVKAYLPIVGGFCPNTQSKVQRTFGLFQKAAERSRIFLYHFRLCFLSTSHSSWLYLFTHSFNKYPLSFYSVQDQFSSVAQSCPTLCDPTNCSTPGLPVHHQLLEFTQTHVH